MRKLELSLMNMNIFAQQEYKRFRLNVIFPHDTIIGKLLNVTGKITLKSCRKH